MKEKYYKIDRRNFLKTIGAAGLGSVFASTKALADSKEPKFPQVPRRTLGKTGVKVPCLSLGSNAAGYPAVLKTALDWGIDYWDTSLVASGGNSELDIGKYLAKKPSIRKKLFLVTKESKSKSAEDLEKCLQTSLEKMKTKYIDLYIGVYMMSDPAKLTDQVRQWAKSAKERKLIRFFGFSTHKNIPQCLSVAAKLGWVDAIMARYNFRHVHDSKMQAALEECHKAGIGIIAMKTQGKTIETEDDKKLVAHFLQRGFTEGQAKIKAVLEEKRVSTACVAVNSVALLTSNIAAVLDKTRLSQMDMEVFREYAQLTCSGYCAGCADICDSTLPDAPYVSDIMRHLMYYNSYGRHDEARRLFAEIPDRVRNKLLTTDYSSAEAHCPQHLPIGKLVARAVSKLT